jgi:nucleotide-binding universal stress UspA family protein
MVSSDTATLEPFRSGFGERTPGGADNLTGVRILIATAGELSPTAVAEFISRLDDGALEVWVATVIEVPRSFLAEIRSEGWHPLSSSGGTAEEADDLIARYVEERGARITDPVVTALAAQDIAAETLYLEGEDPSQTIAMTGDRFGVDLIVLGATKRLFDETQWESVSSRVIRDAGRPVLVVPAAPRDDTGELDLPTSEFELES